MWLCATKIKTHGGSRAKTLLRVLFLSPHWWMITSIPRASKPLRSTARTSRSSSAAIPRRRGPLLGLWPSDPDEILAPVPGGEPADDHPQLPRGGSARTISAHWKSCSAGCSQTSSSSSSSSWWHCNPILKGHLCLFQAGKHEALKGPDTRHCLGKLQS